MIGVIEFITLLCGIVVSFFSEDLFDIWNDENGLVNWPTALTKDVLPVPCHSHNDYTRPMPLVSALKAGCVGVEADVWLIDEELYIAHTRPKVTHGRTLGSLYVNPLMSLLEERNSAINQTLHGVFETDPDQNLVLLIDFKTNGADTLPYVISHLSPLRDRGYLTHWNGAKVVNRPITVVATGSAPFELLTANSTYRDIFYDAPLELMEDGEPKPVQRARSARRKEEGQGSSGTPSAVHLGTYNPSNSYYASGSYDRSIRFPWKFYITSNQLNRIRAQINEAHRRGLKVRYWSTPSWPRNLRNHIWSVLVREGADLLNVDDLESAIKGHWWSNNEGR
ncbi:hypothetical protein UA08_07014 [Talaromyces atroroseus]|uniref:Altered inheritance of mitochondria protein 6 n=1 Tax=Talaromyces atroroseus TaxID=1441469 RepID=A0A225AK50_TALAT|nr:hypothetical protein UA08_07014 [Talaromyces atroroseus]OKL57578.1 hypothetical protein UA08_07014 [Talaromyces atroroseus]